MLKKFTSLNELVSKLKSKTRSNKEANEPKELISLKIQLGLKRFIRYK